MTRNKKSIVRRSLLSVAICLSVGGVAQAERPWGDRMESFEASDSKTPPVGGGVVFVGSSSIRLWDLEKWFPELTGPVLNRGFGGSQIHHSTAELPLLVLKHKPRAVVFYAGDNDINAGKSAELVETNYKKFIALLHAELPETKVYFLAIKPSLSRWKLAPTMKDANERISLFCNSDDRLKFVDTWTPMLNEQGLPREEYLREDGLHLTEEGYAIWSNLVRQALEE